MSLRLQTLLWFVITALSPAAHVAAVGICSPDPSSASVPAAVRPELRANGAARDGGVRTTILGVRDHLHLGFICRIGLGPLHHALCPCKACLRSCPGAATAFGLLFTNGLAGGPAPGGILDVVACDAARPDADLRGGPVGGFLKSVLGRWLLAGCCFGTCSPTGRGPAPPKGGPRAPAQHLHIGGFASTTQLAHVKCPHREPSVVFIAGRDLQGAKHTPNRMQPSSS